jgi:Zn-dependent metalloprotease
MNTLPQTVCGVIPHHQLAAIARYGGSEASDNARATLEHMRELAAGGVQTLLESFPEPAPEEEPGDRQRVYDAGGLLVTPGRQVLPDERFAGDDVQVTEAWDGTGATNGFFECLFGRKSIDGRGMRIDSTVHYGTGFENAMWNGRQMVYGEGDGFVFTRFTSSVDVIAHELTHGVTQHAAALGYSGQTGALNEHISDAFGMMVKQYLLRQAAEESDWLIGSELYGPAIPRGSAVRSFALPGSAYDDPILGRDPQPMHMRGYVETPTDNGGVHINSGILNHAFFQSSMQIGGNTWEVQGPLYYTVVTEQLTADAGFDEFAQATVETAGEMYGFGSAIQEAIGQAWADVGLPVSGRFGSESRRAEEWRTRYAAAAASRRRARWHRDSAARAISPINDANQERKTP